MAAYDLVLLIDPNAADERRAEIIGGVKERIDQGGGTLRHDVDWGERKLAYEIEHRAEAWYHLFQFEAAPDLLQTLDRSLAIEDGVLRHRIIRLSKGVPEAPPKPPPPSARRPPAAPDGDETREAESSEQPATT
jgi:small subunit ribosomal protein S6